MRRVLFLLVALAAGLGLVSGCSSGDSKRTIKVNVGDYTMQPSPATVDAGKVTFAAKNAGALKHEVVVVRADDAAKLPKKADGTIDEEAVAETDKQGEVEDVDPGTTKEATLELKPGTYVMFCNIVDGSGSTAISHFAKGMSATFTVK
jgi:uncharacterized cupredoxin-like copper-binding protein